MEIDKRSRAQLKAYFTRNAIPSEGNFGDLIDAALNQKDDGVAKVEGSPLSVEAVGDDASEKSVLALYRSFADDNATWRVSLNPRQDPQNPNSARPGFGINDHTGRGRLFIGEDNGFVGLGTTTPSHALHVVGPKNIGVFESTDTQAYLALTTSEGTNNRVELCNRPGGRLTLFVAGAGDAVNVLRDGRVGVGGAGTPARSLHVHGSGQLALHGVVNTPSEAGVYWHHGSDYALSRTPGNWQSPNYQQLRMRWVTGIQLDPGHQYGKSYVEIPRGGLRITSGRMLIGPGEPKGLLKVAYNNNDFFSVRGAAAGPGELKAAGWANGWNLSVMKDGKHLYINREAGAASNTYIGSQGRELVVRGNNGFVGVLCEPNLPLQVNGNARCHLMIADQGVTVAQGERPGHLEHDGALYKLGGQVYLTVDDNFYIRDLKNAGKSFHFNTNSGKLTTTELATTTLSTNTATAKSLTVNGNVICQNIRADLGVTVAHGNRGHINTDGALYRAGGQVYLTVDDNFFVRDNSGKNSFHFQTDQGKLNATTVQAKTVIAQDLLQVTDIHRQARTFKIGGEAGKFYPVVFNDLAWEEGIFELELMRSSVHLDGSWLGSLAARFRAHSTNWGHGSDFRRAEIHSFKARFVAWYTTVDQTADFIVWLRGQRTYYWRSNHRVKLADFSAKAKKINNQTFAVRDAVHADLNHEHVWGHKH